MDRADFEAMCGEIVKVLRRYPGEEPRLMVRSLSNGRLAGWIDQDGNDHRPGKLEIVIELEPR
jgi:hypothetical protein